MDAAELKSCLEVVEEIAKTAGKFVLDAVNEEKRVQLKEGIADLVTETDQQVEKFIIQSIQYVYPTHSFIGEESIAAGEKCVLTENPTWIIDPIDGTTNFVHTFPTFAISIALAVDKKVVLGVVYNPLLDEMFKAITGQGAYCNDKKIHVSSTKELGHALVCAEFGSSRDPKMLEAKTKNILRIVEKAHGIRCNGSAALNCCMIAAGRACGYFECGIHCWDIAAGIVVLEEAGGYMSSITGGDLDIMARQILCTSTKELAQEMSSLLTDIPLPSD